MAESVEQQLLRRWVRKPSAVDHKYSRGVVTFVTGSETFPGAALIGIHAALSTGVGMVRYLGPDTVTAAVLTQFPEVVVSPGRSDVSVVGSGIAAASSPRDSARVAQALATPEIHVVDAGALASAEESGPWAILTPHEGELVSLYRRLGLSGAQRAREQAGQVAADLGVWVVAKGAQTTVVGPSGKSWTMPLASPWLATAGTGDALAGVIGALAAGAAAAVAEDPTLLGEIAVAAVVLHTQAAAEATQRNGGGPFTVSDLCGALASVVGHIVSEQE